MRLQGGAEFGVVVDVEPRGVGQAERGRGAGVGAILAFADALQRQTLAAEADGDIAIPKPVSRPEWMLPKPCTSSPAQVHGPLSTDALNPSCVRSIDAVCSA